jgi:hypothetical protein
MIWRQRGFRLLRNVTVLAGFEDANYTEGTGRAVKLLEIRGDLATKGQ